MIDRESKSPSMRQVDCMYLPYNFGHSTVYFNEYNGQVTLKKPIAKQATPGGILADEMVLELKSIS